MNNKINCLSCGTSLEVDFVNLNSELSLKEKDSGIPGNYEPNSSQGKRLNQLKCWVCRHLDSTIASELKETQAYLKSQEEL